MWKIQEADWEACTSDEPVPNDDDNYTSAQDTSPSSDSHVPWFKLKKCLQACMHMI